MWFYHDYINEHFNVNVKENTFYKHIHVYLFNYKNYLFIIFTNLNRTVF